MTSLGLGRTCSILLGNRSDIDWNVTLLGTTSYSHSEELICHNLNSHSGRIDHNLFWTELVYDLDDRFQGRGLRPLPPSFAAPPFGVRKDSPSSRLNCDSSFREDLKSRLRGEPSAENYSPSTRTFRSCPSGEKVPHRKVGAVLTGRGLFLNVSAPHVCGSYNRHSRCISRTRRPSIRLGWAMCTHVRSERLRIVRRPRPLCRIASSTSITLGGLSMVYRIP